MKTKLITLLIINIVLFSNTINAQNKVLLRLKLEKGTTYEMTMTMTNNIDQDMMGQKMKIDQKMEMGMVYQVLEILPNGNFWVEYSMNIMKLNMNVNGQDINMDANGDTGNPMNAVLKTVVENKLKIELDKRAQVIRVEGIEEYAKKLGENPQLAQTMQMFTDEKYFKSFIGQSFNYMPENEIAIGDKWTASLKLPTLMNMETTMNFEAVDITADRIDLNVNSDVNINSPMEQMGMKMEVKMTGKQTGTMQIDSKDGMLRLSDLVQKFDINMKMKNPQSGEDMEIPMIMNSVANISVIKK